MNKDSLAANPAMKKIVTTEGRTLFSWRDYRKAAFTHSLNIILFR